MKIQLTVLLFALLIPVALFVIGVNDIGLSAEQKIRPPLVAGGFYPADPNQLGKMIAGSSQPTVTGVPTRSEK